MSQLLEDLKAARELLSVPERWTKGHLAHDAAGRSVDEQSDKAVCFCIVGAVYKACQNDWKRVEPTVNFIANTEGVVSVPDWQDHPDRTHAEVLDLLDRCIAKAAQSEEVHA